MNKKIDDKNNILESWIMVEHLSEGEINVKDFTSFNNLCEDNYYKLFEEEIKKKKLYRNQNGGVVVYFGVFKFKEIVDHIRKKYRLEETEEEISYGRKFSLALCFDKELKLDFDTTFVTESYYIKRKEQIPREHEFKSFEDEYKNKIKELFNCPKGEEYKEFFNHAFASLISKENFVLSDCYFKVITNLDTEVSNLHSFFVQDLEKAKLISTSTLDKYLSGKAGGHIDERIDLDSKLTSSKFNKAALADILMPKNYPLGRFLGDPNFALYFMQQVAVNISIDYENNQIRSVNGPPGTGKSTLLKDIFAELIVKQARLITGLSNKKLLGADDTKYFQNASIGIIPDEIASLGIVVASSNNGAVQNIVNELPLDEKVYSEFKDKLSTADYFTKIANSEVGTNWNTETNKEELTIKERTTTKEKWGLFSLEGGRKENMDYILTVLKHVVCYLENEYEPNEDVYECFRKEYDKANEYKQNVQIIAEQVAELCSLKDAVIKLEDEYKNTRVLKEYELSTLTREVNKYCLHAQEELKKIDDSDNDIMNSNDEERKVQEIVRKSIEALKLRKPGIFAPLSMKRDFKDKMRIYSEQLEKSLLNEAKHYERLNANKHQRKSVVSGQFK